MGITDVSEKRVYSTNELAPAEEIVFAACGITTGDILKGVQYFGGGTRTHSVLMTYNAGLVRFVDTIHMNKADPKPFKL
jgi:fructose-1,6-bisphosphatase II